MIILPLISHKSKLNLVRTACVDSYAYKTHSTLITSAKKNKNVKKYVREMFSLIRRKLIPHERSLLATSQQYKITSVFFMVQSRVIAGA